MNTMKTASLVAKKMTKEKKIKHLAVSRESRYVKGLESEFITPRYACSELFITG